MKILMVLDREFPPDLRVENEIDTLLSAGYEVHIACYTRIGKPYIEKSGKLIIHRIPISSFIYKSSIASLTLPFYNIFWHNFLRKLVREQSVDVIHVHDLPLVGTGLRLKDSFNLKIIADLHENWPAFIKISKHTRTLAGRLLSPVFLWLSYEKKVLKHTDAIVVVADEAKERLISRGVAAQKISVVSNTLNIGKVSLAENSPDHKETILFYAGGINHHRGLQQVIVALHRAENPNLRFWIFGEGSYKEELVKLVSKLSLKETVIFKGYQPFEKMMAMLQESDFAIIPHIKNEHTDSTLPHKLFQYMYAQKPVIASNCQPVKRILEETGAGIIYDSDHPVQLVDILRKLETFNKTDMASKGKHWIEKTYNWQIDAKKLVDIYESLNY